MEKLLAYFVRELAALSRDCQKRVASSHWLAGTMPLHYTEGMSVNHRSRRPRPPVDQGHPARRPIPG